MERLPVKSSNIKTIGYKEGILEVEFTSGSVYQYNEVPQEIYVNILEAESKGKYFAKVVRPKFKAVKIELEKKI